MNQVHDKMTSEPKGGQNDTEGGVSSANVLVVDDEKDIADLIAGWLSSDYSVQTAYSGEQALEILDNSIDVVLLDRRMPGISGDKILEKIADSDLNCRVAMVTAVAPDFDVLDMNFDDYVTKPVTEEEIKQVVPSLLARSDYDTAFQQYFQLLSKKEAMEQTNSEKELKYNSEYQELLEKIPQAKERLERFNTDVDATNLEGIGKTENGGQ